MQQIQKIFRDFYKMVRQHLPDVWSLETSSMGVRVPCPIEGEDVVQILALVVLHVKIPAETLIDEEGTAWIAAGNGGFSTVISADVLFFADEKGLLDEYAQGIVNGAIEVRAQKIKADRKERRG